MNILSFDIEEWFHINNSDWKPVEKWPDLEKRVEHNTSIIVSFLRKQNIKASFFVLGWVAEYYPELIKTISDEGHDIGYHSYFHRIPKFQSRSEFEKDLSKGLSLLESIIGKNITYYRAPNFSLKNKWILDCLSSNGIEVSSSIKNPIRHKGVRLPNQPFIFTKGSYNLVEFPLITKSFIHTKIVFSGSGYVRILPYSVLKYFFHKEPYLMLYFHPNDFDKNIPTPKELGIIRNRMNSIGTGTTLTKLEKLASHYEFISISQAMDMINRDNLERIDY